MKTRDVMTPTPDVVTRHEPLSHVAEIMRDARVGIVPVVSDRDSMRVEGVITDRDIVIRHVAEGHQGDPPVSEHMTSGRLYTVHPDALLDEVLDVMSTGGVRRVLVTTADGRLAGVVSQADIARVRALEQRAATATGPLGRRAAGR